MEVVSGHLKVSFVFSYVNLCYISQHSYHVNHPFKPGAYNFSHLVAIIFDKKDLIILCLFDPFLPQSALFKSGPDTSHLRFWKASLII